MKVLVLALFSLSMASAMVGRMGISHILERLEADQPLRASDDTNTTQYFFSGAHLDHFGAGSAVGSVKYWNQRYFVDTTFWGGDGFPIFVYIGGEGPQGAPSHFLYMATLAQEHQALMVSLEHRFYGESHPTNDMKTENLHYLTSHQALGDLATFVRYLLSWTGDDKLSSPSLTLPFSPTESKVVGFGGSYPGALAAWVRLKYPSLFAGTVSSSAPVHAEYNFEQYAQTVGSALSNPDIGGSQACLEAVAAGATALHQAVIAEGKSFLPKALRPCQPIKSTTDLSMYESMIFGNFQGTVQYNEESPMPTVADVCTALLDDSGKDGKLDAIARATALFANQSAPFEERCILSSFEDDYITPLRQIKFDNSSSMRQWIWQSCNEFGFFQTTTVSTEAGRHLPHPFKAFDSLTVEFAGRLICEEAYGLKDYAHPATEWTNTAYGDRAVVGDNIVLVNGNMDPWHALGVVNSTDPYFESCVSADCTAQKTTKNEDVVFLANTAHCRDMYRPDAFEGYNLPDRPSVTWAHQRIANAVAGFVAPH